MSQRPAKIEHDLEQLENGLAYGARIRKLLEVLTIKAQYIERPQLRDSVLEDITEVKQATVNIQNALNWAIKEFLQ